MKKIITIFFSFVIISLSLYSFTYAQTTATITLTPENPEPKSKLVLRLESYSFDVNTAMIVWKINGEVVLKGQGERSLTIKTGNVGESSDITVLASTEAGMSIEQKISVTPSSVILLYESPRSYVPLLYEGRSLPSDGALVRVTALPSMSDDGVPLSPANLSYLWSVNDVISHTASGLGKQSANIRLDFLQDKNDVKVVIRSPGGNVATKTITIYPHAIMPLLYRYNQVLGSNFTFLIQKRFETIQDFALALEPFYVSQKETNGEPAYSWYLDGLPTTPLGGKILAMHPKEDSYGTKELSITITGPDKRIQKAETSLELIFDTRK